MPCEPKVLHIHIQLMGPILNICLWHGHICQCEPVKARQSRSIAGCVMVGSQNGGESCDMKDGSWQVLLSNRRYENTIARLQRQACMWSWQHNVRSRILGVVDRFGGVPQHKIPSSCNWQHLAANKILIRAMVTSPKYAWNMTSSDTDQVQDLRSRGDDIGATPQLAPQELVFQSRPPLPRQHQSRINSMILCQVHVGHE